MTLRVFGCTYFIQDLSSGLDKLSPKSIKCVFVGYSKTQKGYLCYNPSTRKYLVSVDVMFIESVPYFSQQVLITISEIVSFTDCVVAYTSFSCFFASTASWNSGSPCNQASSGFQIRLHLSPKDSCLQTSPCYPLSSRQSSTISISHWSWYSRCSSKR